MQDRMSDEGVGAFSQQLRVLASVVCIMWCSIFAAKFLGRRAGQGRTADNRAGRDC